MGAWYTEIHAYFMHCKLNHVGPVTSDATTCLSVKCGCARLQHHALPSSPPFPLLPSSLWGSGEWRGRGSRCAQYKSGSCIPCKRHHCHTSRRLCALLYQPLCFTVCSAVPCPQTASLQHCSIPKDRPPQSYKDHIQQLPAMDHSEALDSTFAARSGR